MEELNNKQKSARKTVTLARRAAKNALFSQAYKSILQPLMQWAINGRFIALVLAKDELWCKECKQVCEIKFNNLSFDHHFGTEQDSELVSDCCGAGILDEMNNELQESELLTILEGI